MKHTIFMVTFRRDLQYLEYCLRSIEKFVTGIDVVIKVPDHDFDLFVNAARHHPNIPIVVRHGDEWKDKGFLWHMNEIMHADQNCPTSDYIWHMDPDCVFVSPVTPDTMVKDGRPLIAYKTYQELFPRCHIYHNWQEACERQLGYKPENEYMQMFPIVFRKDLYKTARSIQMLATGVSVDEWFMKGKNEYPQDVNEFNVLGEVAFKHFNKDYIFQHGDSVPRVAYQAWSRRPPTEKDLEVYRSIQII